MEACDRSPSPLTRPIAVRPLVSTSTEYPSVSSSTIRADSDGRDVSRLMHSSSRMRRARRWITFGGAFGFQPSESAKLALALYLANFLTNRATAVRDLRRGEGDATVLEDVFNLPAQIKTILLEPRMDRPEIVMGRELNVVRGRMPNLPLVKLYFEKESGMLRRIVYNQESAAGPYPTQVDYSDFRDVGGRRVPHIWIISQVRNREFTWAMQNVRAAAVIAVGSCAGISQYAANPRKWSSRIPLTRDASAPPVISRRAAIMRSISVSRRRAWGPKASLPRPPR